MSVQIITPEQKVIIDNLIMEVVAEKDWQKRPQLFLKLFEATDITGDLLVEDHIYSCYRYLPLSIYTLLRINDTAVSDAYFRTYGERIEKEFIYPTKELYSYVRVFYSALSSHSSCPTTDNMAGAIFILRDLSFLQDVTRESGRGNAKAVSWLKYLHNQIDNYMEEGEEREQFRKKIEVELLKAEASLIAEKKWVALDTLNTLFVQINDIDDDVFLKEVHTAFVAKINVGLK